MSATSISEPTYADFLEHQPRGVRAHVRSFALSSLGLASELAGTTRRAMARPRVQFIYLHHVFGDEEASFRGLLAELAEEHAFIGHSEAIERVRDGRIDRPYISVSFDDGFADNLRAARVLEEFGARGCFFVCPGIIGERSPSKLAAFCSQRLEFPVVTSFLGWPELEDLVGRGHEIGGHTMTHPDLGATAAGEAAREISDSYEVLTRRLGGVRHFAWPRGRWANFSPAARALVFDAGYESCSSAVRGCHVAPAPGGIEAFCPRRDHVVANWSRRHIRYLLTRNAVRASARSNKWPAEYRGAS